MLRFISGKSDATYNCPYCFALYLMTIRRLDAKNTGCAICEWCDQGMVEWRSDIMPEFVFVACPSNDNLRYARPRSIF